MNIWDSVHRSLDKASKEAGRIARMQRLRSQLDKVARQINTQEDALLRQVTDLFVSGRLTQSELLPLCHELMSLRQQLSQAQSELQTLQSQGPQPSPQSGQPGTQEANAPGMMGGEIAPTTYAAPPSTPPYQPFDATVMPAIPPPPPPPDMNFQTLHSQETVMNTLSGENADAAYTISSQETVRAYTHEPGQSAGGDQAYTPVEGSQQSAVNRQRCPQCNVETLPGYYFCQNCGSALLPQESTYQPTIRATGSFYASGQETILPSAMKSNEQEQADASRSYPHDASPVPPPSHPTSESQDGG